MRAGDEWRALRIVLFVFGVVESVYVSIPDYGYSYSLLENLYLDPAGWLHELLALWLGIAIGIEWSFRLELRQMHVSKLHYYRVNKNREKV